MVIPVLDYHSNDSVMESIQLYTIIQNKYVSELIDAVIPRCGGNDAFATIYNSTVDTA